MEVTDVARSWAPGRKERAGLSLAATCGEHSGRRKMTTGGTRTRRAALAMGWGAALVFALVGVGVALIVIRAGLRATAAEGWFVLFSTLGVGFVGVVVIVYGLVQLTRARRERCG